MWVGNLWVRSLRPHELARTLNLFEKYTHQEYFVDVVKDRRRSKNDVEFLIGWRDFPSNKYDTCDPITNFPGSEHMITEFQNHWEEDDKIKPNFSASVTTKIFPHRGNTRVMLFLPWNLKTFTVRSRILTWVDSLHQDASVRQPSALGDLSGGSTSMDVHVVEVDLNECGGRPKCLHESATGVPWHRPSEWCGERRPYKSSLVWPTWSDSTCLCLPLLCLVRDSSTHQHIDRDLYTYISDLIPCFCCISCTRHCTWHVEQGRGRSSGQSVRNYYM